MKQTINLSQFRNAFHSYGRGEQFSYEALELIFNHIEEVEQDCGEEIELDVVAICCDFSEQSFDEIRSSYRDCEDLDDDEILAWLRDETTVVGTTAGGVVFVQF